jgi:hypothetical protein
MAADPLVNAQIEGQARIRRIVARSLTDIWSELPNYDRSAVDQWLSKALPVVRAGQIQSVNLTNAYLAAALQSQPIPLDTSQLTGASVRNGTPPEVVYERPFITLWSALQDGLDYSAAVDKGIARAVDMSSYDVQGAFRATAAEIGGQSDKIFGFERVPDANACQFCLVASTQRYHSDDLMPLHNHCGCGIKPLTTEASASGVINRDLYRELKAEGAMDRITIQRQIPGYRKRAAANRARASAARNELERETDPARRKRLHDRAENYDARAAKQDAEASALQAGNVHARVVEHGEMGPTLVNAKDHFTSEADLAHVA